MWPFVGPGPGTLCACLGGARGAGCGTGGLGVEADLEEESDAEGKWIGEWEKKPLDEDEKGCALGAGAGAGIGAGGVGTGKPKSSATASEMAVWKSVHSPNELSSAPAVMNVEPTGEPGWCSPKLARLTADDAPPGGGEAGWNGAVSPREVCELARLAKAGWAPSMRPLSLRGGLNESVGERESDRRLWGCSCDDTIDSAPGPASNWSIPLELGPATVFRSLIVSGAALHGCLDRSDQMAAWRWSWARTGSGWIGGSVGGAEAGLARVAKLRSEIEPSGSEPVGLDSRRGGWSGVIDLLAELDEVGA